MDALQIIKEFGLPIAIIIFVAWFTTKEIWPWTKTQIERLQNARDLERKEFLDALKQITEFASERHAEHTAAMVDFTAQLINLTLAIEELNDHIKQQNSDK